MDNFKLIVLALFGGLIVMGTLCAAEEKDLVGWWKLDEVAGDVAADSSGLANHGTLKNGPVWVPGRIGGALGFANTDETKIYVDIPNSPTLENVQEADYTVAAWVKPNRLPPGTDNTPAYGILVKQGYHIGLVYDQVGLFKMQHHLRDVNNTYMLVKSAPKAPSVWYHVAGVVSRTDGFVKIYVNGVLEATASFPPGSAAREFEEVTWKLGIAGPEYVKYREGMDGIIDDARIYRRALSDAEVASLAKSYTTTP